MVDLLKEGSLKKADYQRRGTFSFPWRLQVWVEGAEYIITHDLLIMT